MKSLWRTARSAATSTPYTPDRRAEDRATMDLSCGLFPGPAIAEQARLAESLGYKRVWTFDSPALYGDVFIAMAQVAEATESIGVGASVLVPGLRHVMVTASAIASLEQLAPGRVAVAIGTGFSGRRMLGKRALPWSATEQYISHLRALLRGEDVEIDGEITRMAHPAGLVAERPVEVPILVAANGPKGLAVARRHADGVMCVTAPQPDWNWCSLLAFGTVLEEGEDFDSARAFEAVAPGVAVIYHGTYEAAGEAVDAMPGGAEWRKEIEAIPLRVRHLAVHEGHMVEINARDRRHVSPQMLAASFTGTPEQLRLRLRELADAGLSELLYAPLGPDPERELRAMREVVEG